MRLSASATARVFAHCHVTDSEIDQVVDQLHQLGRVLRDAQDNWVATRRIWNQHAYHVTNIEEDGTVPMTPRVNWQEPGLNNFRQNVQGGSLFNAPNFVVSVDEVRAQNCALAGVPITITIRNEGSIGVRAGALQTSVYITRRGEETRLTTVENTQALPPGGSEQVVVRWEPGVVAANCCAMRSARTASVSTPSCRA